MKFAYQEFEILPSPATKRAKNIYRPIVPVVLLVNKRFIEYQALIDTGADFNIFEAGISRFLGLKLTSGSKRQIAGLGGEKIKGYEHKLNLRIAGKQYESKVIFSSLIPTYSFGVLGNQGFFDHFKVTFKYPKYIEIN